MNGIELKKGSPIALFWEYDGNKYNVANLTPIFLEIKYNDLNLKEHILHFTGGCVITDYEEETIEIDGKKFSISTVKEALKKHTTF